VPWAIATSGRMATAASALEALGIPTGVPVVTRDQVQYAKPDPDLFLTAANRLNVPIETSIVVGDSVWDLLAARRAQALAVGLLSGGYGQDELERAGAYRVYQDPSDLLRHVDEVGVRNADFSSFKSLVPNLQLSSLSHLLVTDFPEDEEEGVFRSSYEGDLEARLPQAVRTRLWHAASQLTQNSNRGIHVAEEIPPGALGR
jgi:hypothetical protein